MPIYSRNGFTNVSSTGTATVRANENYYNAKFGDVLSESVNNDARIFASMYYADVQEMRAIREGTSVFYENRATDKIKEVFEKIKKAITTFLGKVKALLDAAITRISSFITGDLSKRATKYEKYLLDPKIKAKVQNIKLKDFRESTGAKINISAVKDEVNKFTKNASPIEGAITSAANETTLFFALLDAAIDRSGVIEKKAKGKNGKVDNSKINKAILSIFVREPKTMSIKEANFGPGKGVEGLLKACKGKDDSIKRIKETKKDCEDACKNFIRQLDDAQKRLSKKGIDGKTTIKLGSSNDEGNDLEVDQMTVRIYKNGAKCMQKAIGVLCKSLIYAKKYEVRRNGAALSKAISSLKSKAMYKSSYEEASYLDMVYRIALSEGEVELADDVDELEVNEVINNTDEDIYDED